MPLATASRRRAPVPDDAPPAPGTRSRSPWPVTPARKTRPALAAGGVLIVVICAAIGASVAGQSSKGVPYLEVTQAVPAGAPLAQADLSVVDLDPASGLAGVPATDEASVLGTRATAPLAPGTLLVAGEVSAAPPVPRGDAVVGASLSPDQLPTEIQPGDSVLVVLTGSSGPASDSSDGVATGSSGNARPSAGQVGAPGGVLATGTVLDVIVPGSTSSVASTSSDETIVSLAVPVTMAAEVTAASAADQVSLALVQASPVAAHGGRS